MDPVEKIIKSIENARFEMGFCPLPNFKECVVLFLFLVDLYPFEYGALTQTDVIPDIDECDFFSRWNQLLNYA